MTQQVKNEKAWEATHSAAQTTDSRPLVKTVGCVACWASKIISLTQACWPPLDPATTTL